MLGLFTWLGATLLALFLANRAYFDHFWAFCVFIGGFLWESFSFVGELVIRAFQGVASVYSAPGSAPCASGLGQWMAIANTFVPVDEILHMLAALIAIWVLVGTYRLVKSWIPTLTGGS